LTYVEVCGAYETSAIPNSERIYVVSADQIPSVELDLNDKSRVSGSKNFEFGIAYETLRFGI
jgi:hypothetical protein